MRRPQVLSIAAGMVVLFTIAAVVTSCLRRQASGDPDALSTRVYSRVTDGQVDCIGQLGNIQHRYQEWSHNLAIPFSQQGREAVTVFCRQLPGPTYNSFTPLLVLLLRTDSPTIELYGQIGVTSRTRDGVRMAKLFAGEEPPSPEDEARIELLSLTHTYPTAGGTFATRYVLPDDRGEELFHLADKPYPLTNGRVFLIDLASDPVWVLQVDDDPAALLPATYPTKQDLRAFPGKLDARHPTARDFRTR